MIHLRTYVHSEVSIFERIMLMTSSKYLHPLRKHFGIMTSLQSYIVTVSERIGEGSLLSTSYGPSIALG
jgi:hypothetical protein